MTSEPLDNPYLSRDEASMRAENIHIEAYRVHVDISEAINLDVTNYPVETRIDFSATKGSEIYLNYLGESVGSIVLNGKDLDPKKHAGSARIWLPDLAEKNVVEIHSHSYYSRSGEGLHRFHDVPQGEVYLYTQYEPADARRVFPNAEQPDLKASFTFLMTGPSTWKYASNTVEAQRHDHGNSTVTVEFEPTKRISTYITTLLAGPYAVWNDRWEGDSETGASPVDLRIFARQAQAEFTDTERLFEQTKSGLDYFHKIFRYAYPWGKYDQAFVPEYNLGAMENPGLVTFNEDYIYTSEATESQYQNRANTLMHEMVHMWFGDLVTMKWWDDLWLKESFADFIGALAVDEATEYTGAWVTFAHGRKAWAYLQDSYPTTHPIVADIPDLEAARQNFDGITYAKGAAVLKQLAAFVGIENFLSASRKYFAAHEFGSGELKDFLKVLQEASGQDMSEWAQLWLQTAGPSTLSVEIVGGKISVKQSGIDPATGESVLRPHTFKVGVYQLVDEKLQRTQSVDVQMPAGSTEVQLPELDLDTASQSVILPNDEDLTYALIRVDPHSLKTALKYPTEDQLAAASIWSMFWTMVRDGSLTAGSFVGVVAAQHVHIHDIGMHARVLDQAVAAINGYAPEGQRQDLRKVLASGLVRGLEVLGDRSDRQRSAAKTLARLAQGNDIARSQLLMILGSDDPEHTSGVAPGLVVDADMRWAILTSLASAGVVERTRLDEELARDNTSVNALYHREAVAALPVRQQRRTLWQAVLEGETGDGMTLSNSELTATANGLATSAPEHTDDLWPQFFSSLIEVWESRSNGLASRTINGLFPMQQTAINADDQTEHPIIQACDAWLSENENAQPALRRIIIERRSDLLNRLQAQATVLV